MRKIGKVRWMWALAALLVAGPAMAYTYSTVVTLKFVDDVGGTANSGTLVIGNSTGRQVAVDDNEIQARAAGGGASPLYLNHAGGNVVAGEDFEVSARQGMSLEGTSAIAIDYYDDFTGVYGDDDDRPEVFVLGDLWVVHNVSSPSLAGSTQSGVCADVYGRLKRCSSSRELKKNVSALRFGLREVMALEPVSFDWKQDGTHDVGFIAEDAGEWVPELAVRDRDGKITGFNYQHYTAVLTHAVQEQQGTIQDLQTNLEASQEALSRLGHELERRDRDLEALRDDLAALRREVAAIRKASARH